ncbi:MAG: TRAP transporter small permease [Rhodospirillales bacterium]|jgi:C4-dicarboxylate transporter, DctQ subunit|nr:TRAP transporter small permease [Rhodospirillales bacterium]
MTSCIIHFLHKAEEGFLAFLIAAMALVTFSQVIARYVFNSGAVWALELTTFLFAWLVLMGIAYGIRIHSHIGVDALVKKFSKNGQRVLGMISVLASLIYAGLLLYGAWDQVIGIVYEYDFEAEDLKIPLWIPQSVLLIGLSLMIWRLLVLAYGIITNKTLGMALGDEAQDALEAYADLDIEEELTPSESKTGEDK